MVKAQLKGKTSSRTTLPNSSVVLDPVPYFDWAIVWNVDCEGIYKGNENTKKLT